MFALTDKGDLYVYKIEERLPSENTLDDHFSKNRPQIEGILQHDNPLYVKDLKDLKMIAAGTDHMLALAKDGKVYAMGDDTFGQCG